MTETLDSVLRFVREVRGMGAVAVQVGDVTVRFERAPEPVDVSEMLPPPPKGDVPADDELTYWSAD